MSSNCKGQTSARIGIRLADEIARMVDVGVLNSGDLLPAERELSAIFCVSRQTIRSAISELERDLYVTKRVGRETRVNGRLRLHPKSRTMALNFQPSCSPVELFEVRIAVETEVALCVMEKVDPDTLDELEAIGRLQHDMAHGTVGQWLVDLSFQLRLVGATGNSLMASLAQDLYYFTAPLAGGQPRALPLGELVDALRAKSAEAAMRFVRGSLAIRAPDAVAPDATASHEPGDCQTPWGSTTLNDRHAAGVQTGLFWPGFTSSIHRA